MESKSVVLVNASIKRLTSTNVVESGNLFGKNLGILYLVASLEKHGYRTEFQEKTYTSISVEEMVARIMAANPFLVGFSVNDAIVESTYKIIKRLREEYDGPIVLGGYTPTFSVDDFFREWPEIDYIIVREGDNAIVALADYLNAKRDITTVPNLYYRNGTGYRFTHDDDPIDVTKVPWMKRTWSKDSAGAALMISRRGCSSNCSFCSESSFYKIASGSRVRFRTPEDVVDEIDYCMDNGVQSFLFWDSCFGLASRTEKEWASQFIQEVKKRKLSFIFSIELRVIDLLRGESLLRELCDIGLYFVNIGAESFLDRQLKLYGKGYSSKDAMKAIEIANDVPCEYSSNLIFWDPYITLEEAIQHIEILDQIKIQHQLQVVNVPFFINILIPRKGTKINKFLTEQGLIKKRENSFHHFAIEVLDPKVKYFFRTIWQDALATTHIAPRYPVFAKVPILELNGKLEAAQQLRKYATKIVQTDLDYFKALLTICKGIEDEQSLKAAVFELHVQYKNEYKECASLIPK